MIHESEDVIAAVATPAGRAALGIVRISGRGCGEILSKIFIPKRKTGILPFRPTLGKLVLSEERYIDEVLLTFFQQPHSYTREDLAEITCHGNPLILEQILERVVHSGARLARPGEFTFRAFLNGRIDLVQAGAVADLISADTLYQAELALNQLDGRLSRRFQEIRSKFIEFISLMEGNIDFSEEQHYNFIDKSEAIRRLDELAELIRKLLGTFERGRLVREGFSVALIGKPNVGKSSVFNELAGTDRAIVTALPGTTRDYLEERIHIGNFLIHLLDTAGIRESEETVEKEGIARSRQMVEKADLILFIIDGSEPVTNEDLILWKEIEGRECVLLCNKSDLSSFRAHKLGDNEPLEVSAQTGAGISTLVNAIHQRVECKAKYSGEDSLISSVRHRDILKQALACLGRGREGIEAGMSEEFPLMDLHEGLRNIGEITGEVTIDDIYQQIFSNFCIGK